MSHLVLERELEFEYPNLVNGSLNFVMKAGASTFSVSHITLAAVSGNISEW